MTRRSPPGWRKLAGLLSPPITMPATAAPSTSTALDTAIATARNTIAAALAEQMKAAALAAIDRTDFHALAVEALVDQDIGDADALTAAAEELLNGHDWEISL